MKKLIATALAAAFTAPLAFAEVTISGSVRSALDYLDYGGTSQNDSKFRIADQASRITLKGEDKLDNGSSLLWQVENRFNVGEGSSNTNWGSRNTFIGYKGDWGTLRFGKIDNAYKLSSADYLQAIDSTLNEDSSYFGKNQLARRLGERQDQIVLYDSPNWSGFRVRGSYDFDSGKDADLNADTATVAGSYSTDVFSVGASYALANDRKIDTTKTDIGKGANRAAGTKIEGLLLGGSVKLADFTLSALWERVTWDNGSRDWDQDTYGVGALYKSGKLTFQAAYLFADDVSDRSESGGQQFTLGGAYSLSKQSRIYLTYTQVDNDEQAKFLTEAPGLLTGAGYDYNIVSLGVRTDF
ncbi:porin [Chitiniphilus purpureus]|uniref:Porin n=1 Tax=Chitiniphilus purpureus TaxID=2981137 RepID=A0ABY6DS20_9NEIS|nr:porin [Chitiniphilus sp. CD1]UXY17170.1 porin [Chitiniphilus sp. CD1]